MTHLLFNVSINILTYSFDFEQRGKIKMWQFVYICYWTEGTVTDILVNGKELLM